MPGEEKSPLIDFLLIILAAIFSVTAVAYAAYNLALAFIPLLCAFLFFLMFMAVKGVIGGQ